MSQLATRGLEALLAHDVELTGDGGDKVPALARTQPRHEHPDQLGSPRRRRSGRVVGPKRTSASSRCCEGCWRQQLGVQGSWLVDLSVQAHMAGALNIRSSNFQLPSPDWAGPFDGKYDVLGPSHRPQGLTDRR